MENMENITMYERIHESVKKSPHGLALYYQGTRISFKKFDKLINRTADIFANRLGIKPGDIVLVAQPNIPEVLIIFYALNKLGAITNFVHPFTPFNQIKMIMRKTHVKYAFLFEQRVAKEVEHYRSIADKIYVTRVEDFLPLGKKIIYHTFMNFAIRRKLGKWRGSFKGFKYFKDLKPTGVIPPTHQGDNKATSILLHSGSTTGDPKTICLSNYNFNYVGNRTCDFLACESEFIKGKAMLSVLPSFHGFGLCMTMHAPLCELMPVVLMPKFNVEELVKTMKKVNIASICGVPTMYEKMIENEHFLNSKQLKNLYVVYCGGDTLSPILKKKWDDAMSERGSKCKMFEGYGLTEAISVNCVNTYDHNKDGSIGYPMKGVQFRIVDQQDNEVPRGTIGEITMKTPALMVGYFEDEENTKKCIKDGWLYTGDLGYMDEDGFIFFSQRKKRVVKVSGVGVFPTEVERLIETIPGVEKACAIQIPDPKLQHALKVFVVAKYFDEEGMRNQIIETCRKYLIRWSVPKEVEFRKELPLTMLNKIDFNKLQKEEDALRGVNNAQK